jgi:primosomal protein N' (replication factor Y)
VVGSQRTAEELGRAFPQTPVVTSSAGHVHARLAPRPALVVATPGAEPVVDGGYSVALLLDAWLTLARPDLRTSEEALRRWLNAAALVRPADQGGRVVVIGDPALQPVQALLRWDPAGAAERELADRVAARLPPAAKTATITGASTAVADFVRTLEAPDRSEVLGPLQVEEQTVRAVVRCPREDSAALVAALKVAQSIRSARKDPTVRVQVDPHELG